MSYLKSLSREIDEMWTLVLSQHQKSLTALTTLDKDLAREIILIEERVNSCEQFIESDCEHYFSICGSQNLDVPYAMFVLKTAKQLEIIGDLANKIADEILNISSIHHHELIQKINIAEPFRGSNKILELLLNSFDKIDPSLAQAAISRIKICHEMISDSNNLLADHLQKEPEHINHALNLFSVLESINKTLEVSQNICSRIINYNGASVILR